MLRTLASIYIHVSCLFYSGPIRTLVAMATCSSSRLIMGKVDIVSFCCLTGYWGGGGWGGGVLTNMFIE